MAEVNVASAGQHDWIQDLPSLMTVRYYPRFVDPMLRVKEGIGESLGHELPSRCCLAQDQASHDKQVRMPGTPVVGCSGILHE